MASYAVVMHADAATDGYPPRLRTAVAAVGRAFADVPRLGRVAGCLNCFGEDELTLLGGDLDLVPDDLVRRFAYKWTNHWSAAQYGILWRRLTPRILRLLIDDPSMERGLLLRGLGSAEAEFGGWPVAQRVALLDALAAVLEVAVTRWSPGAILELLDGLGHVHHDVAPWLVHIQGMSGPAAEAGSVRLVCSWAVDVLWGEEPFCWSDPANSTLALRNWLCSPAVQHLVDNFAMAHPRCKTAADAQAAIYALRHHQRSPWRYPGYGYNRMKLGGLRDLNGFLEPLSPP
jgi:hypothetical protein